jgi:hypothetical protein
MLSSPVTVHVLDAAIVPRHDKRRDDEYDDDEIGQVSHVLPPLVELAAGALLVRSTGEPAASANCPRRPPLPRTGGYQGEHG